MLGRTNLRWIARPLVLSLLALPACVSECETTMRVSAHRDQSFRFNVITHFG